MQARPSRDAYFMNLARMASQRATCPKRRVGAVLVKEGRVVSTGYNGSPPDMPHCDENGCVTNGAGKCIATIHAEMNALLLARDQGDTLYCTDKPCLACLKAALAHNPRIRIVFWRSGNDPDRDLFPGAEERMEPVTMTLHKEMLRHLPHWDGERRP